MDDILLETRKEGVRDEKNVPGIANDDVESAFEEKRLEVGELIRLGPSSTQNETGFGSGQGLSHRRVDDEREDSRRHVER